MKQPSFDDIIRKKADTYEAPVPADAWGNIVQGKKKKRRVLFFWWIVGLLLLGAGTTFLYTGVKEKTPMEGNYAVTETKELKENTSANNRKDRGDEATAIKNDFITDTTAEKGEKTIAQYDSNMQSLKDTINKNLLPGDAFTRTNLDPTTIHKKELPGKRDTKNKPEKNKKAFSKNTLAGNDLNVMITNAYAGNNQLTGTDKTPANENVNPINSHQDTDGSVDKTNTAKEVESEVNFTDANVVAISIFFPKTTYELPNSLLHSINAHTNSDLPVKIKTQHSRWKVDFGIAPSLSFRGSNDLMPLSRTILTTDAVTTFKADETKISLQPGIAFSIALRKKISKNIHLGIGFQYAVIKEKIFMSGTENITHYSIVKKLVNDNNGTYLVNDTAKAFSSGKRIINGLNSYITLSMPVIMQMEIFPHRFYSLEFAVGVYLNVLRNYKNSIQGNFVSNNTMLKETKKTTGIGVDFFSGLRFSTTLNKRIGMFAEPGIRFNLLKNKNSGSFNTKHIHQAGVGIGLTYSF